MEANAGRDPFWLAQVRAEVTGNPEQRETIEDLCTVCHMPMAHFSARAEGVQPLLFDQGFLSPDHELHELAMDGVSCTLCHQIREEGLGLPSSYNGGYEIDAQLLAGTRLSFGPYSVSEEHAALMQQASGFVPVQGLHVARSEFCATCHTFYTAGFPGEGGPVEFPIQVTYLEWFSSDFRQRAACQDCHMPEPEGGVRIATMSANPRSPFAQHTFVGANAYMLEMLKTFSDPLGVTASEQMFEESIQRTSRMLEEATADVILEGARVSGSRLRVDVAVENMAGHKLPTGFPSRRIWIRLVVQDPNGEVLFESGGVDPDGSIRGNDADTPGSGFEPHYLAIVDPEQVQIYETVLQGIAGGMTTDLLQARAYLKDNRLLPSGLEPEELPEDIALHGRVEEDEDFAAGRDAIEYVVQVGDAPGPFMVTVELLYQSIAVPWVEALRSLEAQEARRFLEYYASIPNLPQVIAVDSIEVSR